MTRYGSDDITIEFDNSSGALQDMTAYIQTFNGMDVDAILEESHSFGESWVEFFGTGVRRMGDITLGGFYDDTATTGPDAIFNDPGCVGTAGGTRTLTITWGGSKTTTLEVVIKSYNRRATRNELTKFEVLLAPSGSVTEA